MPSGTPTSFGRYHDPEPPHHLTLLHRHDPATALQEVTHDLPLAVLDQENFGTQGIDTSTLLEGAPKVDALGNCVLNAGTVAVSFLGMQVYLKYLEALGLAQPDPTVAFSDTKTGEEAAICAYHGCTDQTGSPATEWWPTDCGSSGVALVHYLTTLGVVSSQQIAATPQDIVSLLQTSPVLVGGPWFNAWMEPGPMAMIDGNGTASDLDAAIHSGVAGGHERLEFQVEKLALDISGNVVPEETILVDRNSWGKSWGDAGCYRVHLSTYQWLASYSDWRSLTA